MFIRYTLILLFVSATVLAIWLLFIKSEAVPEAKNEPVASQWADLYQIQNQSDRTELETATRDIYSNFTTNQAGTEGWQTFTKGTKQIPAPIGLTALGVAIPAEMETVLNIADWGVHSCKSTTSQPKFVLRLLFALGTQGELVTYTGKVEMLKAWENTLMSDVQKIIFPEKFYKGDLSIVDSYANNDSYDVSGVRQTAVNSGANSVGEFGYVIVGDHVLIGNDMKCMNDIGNNILGVVP